MKKKKETRAERLGDERKGELKYLKRKKNKMKKVMKEFDEGELHSGSKTGPIVKNPKQAVAIAYSEAKRRKKK